MSRNPWSLKLRAAYSRTFWNVSSGTVTVPGNRMCPVAGLSRPSGTYAITGATSVWPRARAIFSERTFTRRLCLPSVMCGPLCSIPPTGTMIVVVFDPISSRSSVQVNSSRSTVSGACANARPAQIRTRHIDAIQPFMSLGSLGSPSRQVKQRGGSLCYARPPKETRMRLGIAASG